MSPSERRAPLLSAYTATVRDAITTPRFRQNFARAGLKGSRAAAIGTRFGTGGHGMGDAKQAAGALARRTFMLALCSALAACGGGRAVEDDYGLVERGRSTYRIAPGEEGRIQFGTLDAVNALRSARGLPALSLNPQLNAAALTHSRDMARQNRPWNFGSDGSSPIDRIRRAGYGGQLVGEAISESFESESETLAAWMDDPSVAAMVLDPSARDMGLGWFQQENGKLWWTMEIARPATASFAPAAFGAPGLDS